MKGQCATRACFVSSGVKGVVYSLEGLRGCFSFHAFNNLALDSETLLGFVMAKSQLRCKQSISKGMKR